MTITTAAGELERFTHNTNGSLTYIGSRPAKLRAEGRATILMEAGLETKEVAFYLYKDSGSGFVQQASTVIAQDLASVFQTPTSPEFVAVDTISLVTNDVIQMFVENRTDDTDITITALKLIIE